MIVVVIIGLLAAMAIPAFNKVRQTSQDKTIINNLRQIASASDQYFIEEGQTSAARLIGTKNGVQSDSHNKLTKLTISILKKAVPF